MKLKQTLPVLALSSVLSLSVPSCIILEDSGYIHEGQNIQSDVNWSGSHTIKSWVTIEDATLTIKSGATIKFDRGAYLTIGKNGRIIAEGSTGANQILFTANTNQPSAGYWGGIRFNNDAANGSKFSHTIFEYATKALDMDEIGAAVDNCEFSDISETGIELGEKVSLASFKDNYFRHMNGADAINAHPNALGDIDTIEIDEPTSSAIYVRSGHITKRVTWKKQPIPYELESWLNLENNLTIEDGNTIFMNVGGHITVAQNGAIFCDGKDKSKITFTSISNPPKAGDWQGISFNNDAQANSSFAYTRFEYATTAIEIDSRGASIDHCDFVTPKVNGVLLGEEANVSSFKDNFFTAMKNANAISANPNAIGQLDTIVVDEGPATTQILVHSDYVPGTLTWGYQPVPFIIEDWLTVDSTGSLTIAGDSDTSKNEVRLHYKDNINVNGALNLAYTKFTYADSASQPWGTIYYNEGAKPSTIEHCEFMYGGGSDDGAISVDDGVTLTISDSVFSQNITSTNTCDIVQYSDATLNKTSTSAQVCVED